MFDRLREDIQTVKDRDPAATSVLEILFLYPGLKAIRRHRVAHWFFKHNMKFIARVISQQTVKMTNIEIHPGATIGRRFFIDHGTGVVIGETAVIGDNCTIYQGVTLGGTGKDTGKRHPTLGNGVLVGAGAKLLGNFTVGDGAKIAAGAVVLGDVPSDSTAVGIPARVVRRSGQKICDEFDQTHVPDPVSQELCRLSVKLQLLENKIKEIENISSEERKDAEI